MHNETNLYKRGLFGKNSFNAKLIKVYRNDIFLGKYYGANEISRTFNLPLGTINSAIRRNNKTRCGYVFNPC